MSRCAIYGASGHGKVVAELAELNGFSEVLFYDCRWPEHTQVGEWGIEGDFDSLLEEISRFDIVIVAIGNNRVRLEKHNALKRAGANLGTLLHPSAVVSRYTSIGQGTVIMAGAIVNPFVSIGEACIINTSASIDHDSIISDGCHVSPGARLAGSVIIGSESWLGIGSQVIQSTSIGSYVIVGAGATVINDIPSYNTVVGSPAKPLV